jgi:hypothetical protein
LERCVVQRHVTPVIEDAGLDAAGLTGGYGTNAELLPGRGHRIPNGGAETAVEQVALKHPAARVDSKKGDRRYQGLKYRVVLFSSISLRSLATADPPVS